MFKLQMQGLRPRTPKSLRAADFRHPPWWRTPLRKTPEPPWSVLLCLVVFSVDVVGRGGTSQQKHRPAYRSGVFRRGPSAGMPAEGLARRLRGGAGGTPPASAFREQAEPLKAKST